jgi:hypothetical protein
LSAAALHSRSTVGANRYSDANWPLDSQEIQSLLYVTTVKIRLAGCTSGVADRVLMR